LKHFTWSDVANFSEKDRWMISYRQGGSGDWKASKEAADGYLMVTVNGKPYWSDAVGQIPFAVDYFTDQLGETGNYSQAMSSTIQKGREYGEGKLVGGSADNSNRYDNYFILRGAAWAGQRYKVLNGKLIKTNYNPNMLGIPISPILRTRYLIQ